MTLVWLCHWIYVPQPQSFPGRATQQLCVDLDANQNQYLEMQMKAFKYLKIFPTQRAPCINNNSPTCHDDDVCM